MLTLTYGYLKPQSGDKGVALFTALETNIQKLNDHTHNGSDSSLIDSKSVLAIPQTLNAGDWVTYGGPPGFYRQLVTLPVGFMFDTVQIGFRVGGRAALLGVEKVSSTTYYLYTIDNTISPVALYGG